MFELKFTIYHRAAEVCRHWQQASCIALGIQITDLGITLTAEVEESLEQTPWSVVVLPMLQE